MDEVGESLQLLLQLLFLQRVSGPRSVRVSVGGKYLHTIYNITLDIIINIIVDSESPH